jgi:hypothetical protein
VHLINTSCSWNAGDDFIRWGVERLLGLEDTAKVYINRAQVNEWSSTPARDIVSKRRAVWSRLANMPSPTELVGMADSLIAAGTPEWLRLCEPMYEAAIARGLPIYLCGVGMEQGPECFELLERMAPLVRGATARDNAALEYMRRAGIDAQWFPDPAFIAPREISTPIDGLLVVYRAKGGNGVHSSDFDWYWRAVRERFDEEIRVVTCHEPGEVPLARAIFGRERVFYSSESRDFAKLYARAWRCISGRIHGAAPVVAAGGTALLVYPSGSWSSVKAECMRLVSQHTSRLRVQTYSEPLPETIGPGPEPLETARPLGWLLNDHFEYWKGRKP